MSSSFTRLYVHLVWATRHRTPWIEPAVAPRLHGFVSHRCAMHDCVAIAAGSYFDHAHVVVGLHPTVAVATLVRDIKACSSAFLRRNVGIVGFAWQEGYGAFSLRETDLETVVRYVRGQADHHANGTTLLDWERMAPPDER